MGFEAGLAAAREEGFVARYTPNNETYHKRRAFLVVGIATETSHKKNRDAIRRSWMPTGNVFYSVSFHSIAYNMKFHLMCEKIRSLSSVQVVRSIIYVSIERHKLTKCS